MEKVFFFLYSILSFVLYLLAFPFLLLFSFKNKYKVSIPARFFLWKNNPFPRDGIWFHSCSFGEAKALKPLINIIPKHLLRLSSTTYTGIDALKDYSKEVRYLPFESWLLGWIRPQKALIVMEAEFWYLLFSLAQKRGAKTLLVNARMSDKSYPKYQKMSWLYKQIFAHIDEVYAQTSLDKERLESLGAKNVTVTGNIKLAYLPQISKKIAKPQGMLICGASTHETEEYLILEAFLAFKKENKDAKLILAPRHPERFKSVKKQIQEIAKKEHWSFQKYTENSILESDIILLNVLGELINIYAITDLVILGGAFVPIGGHNAGEAAQFGCKIISGKHYFNQIDIFRAIEGISIVEDFNLKKRLLQHGLLKPCKLIQSSDISPILKSLKKLI